jgi:hypothetical protein
MAFSLPDPPTPPNPMATAAAQTGTNVSTAIANSYLGNVNQETPYGNLTNTVTDNYSFTDPTSGQTFNIPRWTAKQTLTPQGQNALTAQQGAQVNMANLAQQQSGAIGKMLSQPFDTRFNAAEYLQARPDVLAAAQQYGADPYAFAAQHWQEFGRREMPNYSSLPQEGDINLLNNMGYAQGSFGATPGPQTGYASGGDITRTYGTQDNFEAERARIEQGLMQRLSPQLELERSRSEQQLADRGIRAVGEPGGGAYGAGMDIYNRMANDARLAVIAQGGQEQQRLNQMANAQATFQNQAQQQATQQNAALAAFYNQAGQQMYEQAAGRAQFGNQATAANNQRAQQIFAAQQAARNQALQEQYQQRNQPLNEITALLSGSQVQQPSFINAARTQIPTTDVAGLINQGFAQQNDIYKTQSNFWGDILGGTLGAAGNIGSRVALSDRREKENIRPLGDVFSEKGDRLPIYDYSYKSEDADAPTHTGPMAQDVEKVDPRAVRTIGGRKHINVDRLGAIFGRA